MEAVGAAGPLGISSDEAARRGTEVDRILRQRDEEGSFTETIFTKPSPSSDVVTPFFPAGASKATAGERVKHSTGRRPANVPRLGKLEDRRVSRRKYKIS